MPSYILEITLLIIQTGFILSSASYESDYGDYYDVDMNHDDQPKPMCYDCLYMPINGMVHGDPNCDLNFISEEIRIKKCDHSCYIDIHGNKTHYTIERGCTSACDVENLKDIRKCCTSNLCNGRQISSRWFSTAGCYSFHKSIFLNCLSMVSCTLLCIFKLSIF